MPDEQSTSGPQPLWWRYPGPPTGAPFASLEGIERLLIALTDQLRPLAEVAAAVVRIEITQGEILAQLAEVRSIMAATQADVDKLNASVAALSTTLDGIGTDLDSLDTAVAALKTANPGLDLTGVQTALDAAQAKSTTADTHIQAITAAAGNVTPTPAPTGGR